MPPISANSFLFRNESTQVADAINIPLFNISGSRTSTTDISVYIDGTLTQTNPALDSGTLCAFPVCFGAVGTGASSASGFIDIREQVSGFGSGLTQAEMTTLTLLIQALNAALGR